MIFHASRSGDVLLSNRPWTLSNYFISGKYKHVGVIHMDHIVEAKFEGVVSTLLVDFCMKKNSLCLLRPRKRFGIGVINDVTTKALEAVGSSYDFSFTRGGQSYYCSELVEHCWGDFVDVPKKKIFNKYVLNPDDLADHKDWKKIIEIN